MNWLKCSIFSNAAGNNENFQGRMKPVFKAFNSLCSYQRKEQLVVSSLKLSQRGFRLFKSINQIFSTLHLL